jgi:hypothetical protein
MAEEFSPELIQPAFVRRRKGGLGSNRTLEHRRDGLRSKQELQSPLNLDARRQSHGQGLLAHLPTAGDLPAGTSTIVFQPKTKEFDLQSKRVRHG